MCDNTSPLPSRRRRKSIKYDCAKLPTPPPDPVLLEKSSEEKNSEVLEYLENFARSTSLFAPVAVTEDAFDHLERLYRLMEQMLDLREQNGRLHRKIRDLEYLHKLEQMRKKLDSNQADLDCSDLEKDTQFAETILESILQDKSVISSNKPPHISRIRHSILRKSRRNSCIEKTQTEDQIETPSKVSKWTKVKAAFRWEKASTNMSDTKSQDSGVHMPNNCEIARYLRVPSTSDETGHSQGDSGAGISTPGSLSTASSNEDFHRIDSVKSHQEDARMSSEDENASNYIPKSSQKYLHPHRTRWSKMKDIVTNPKGSFKKKHRLSAASDDIQIDVELCSDNEEVFEDDKLMINNDIPREIFERYQRLVAEDTESDCERKSSKWTRVKKAFISHHEMKNDTTEEEIQRNYRQLQKKLSLEFHEKITEWEKTKQNASPTSNPSISPSIFDEPKDLDFMKKMEEWDRIKNQSSPSAKQKHNIQSTKDTDLPPDFKKKLQEWEKIKKYTSSNKKKLGEIPKCKSVCSTSRSDNSPAFECPVITDEFKKKLEEWKEIKARGEATWSNLEQKILQDKTPSPKLSRKSSAGTKSNKKDKELHWFEKELSKIEKEKQRLERERQKFLEREESLSKLRKSILAGNKKELLVQTPCGMYKFEGISRKFTQKLYEWEKAQGIAPEASTFALLSTYDSQHNYMGCKNEKSNTPPIMRSKSADSIAISAATLACPVITKQPSSLSLNDIKNLEEQLEFNSKSSSLRYLLDDEPEAMLVEVEDYEEETASPLKTFVEKKQVPIYQRQETRALCEGETLVAPNIRKSESTRAQKNYSLIEDIVTLLRILAETEVEIKNSLHNTDDSLNENLEKLNDSQKLWASKMTQKLYKLQEANNSVALNIAKDDEINTNNHVIDILESVQDLSNELLQLSENLEQKINTRILNEYSNNIFELIKEMRSRMLELRRHLSYVCAASDLTAPSSRRKKSFLSTSKVTIHKTQSNESKDSRCDTTSDSREGSQKSKRYIKFENNSSNNSNQGAIKKRIKYYRQKNVQKNNVDSDEDDDIENKKVRQHKKLSRTRSISENNVLINTDSTSFIVPSKSDDDNTDVKSTDSPVTVFVKTTRKLFTPIAEVGKTTPENNTIIVQRPPLPASPIPQRKVYKDISPSIKYMISKYNQKLENDTPISPHSSGSSSPLWRSPISERRVKAQTEKYQEIIQVQKSASTSHIQSDKNVSVPRRKTSECSQLKQQSINPLNLDLNVIETEKILRQKKIQKAKEEFLNSPPVSAPAEMSDDVLKYPERNRLSQISVDSSSSYSSICAGNLQKSASAGMINIDAESYKQIDPEFHGGGYVSLPRSTQKLKERFLNSKLSFGSIASKFRKVKMRRGKEKSELSKGGAVSALCRQSLVVDIAAGSNININNNNNSGESSRNQNEGSTVKKSLFFRKK